MANPIPYSELKPYWISQKLPNIPLSHIQKALFVGIIACAIISLIPSLGWGGALATRSLSLTMVGVQVIHSLKNKEDKGVIFLQITRLASVAIGLAGVATHLNILVIAALAGDMFFQMVETGRGAKQKDLYKSLCHLSFIIIDGFAMTALLTGGWPFAVAAASLSSVAMFVFAGRAIWDAVRKNDLNYVLDAVCYVALGGIGIASAVRSAEILEHRYIRSFYIYKNTTDQTVTFFDKYGNEIAKADPGQTISFDVSADKTFNNSYNRGVIYQGDKYFNPISNEFKDVVIQKPMTAEEFPILPVDSSAVVIDEQKWITPPPPREADFGRLDLFINPSLDSLESCAASEANKPQIILKHQESERWKRFDMASMCILSTHVYETVWWLSRKMEYQNAAMQAGNEPLNDIPRACDRTLTLDCDGRTFALLMAYFEIGALALDRLTESELIALNNVAVNLKIDGLEKRCCREIALRLKNFKWENTSLFNPYIGVRDRLLCSLVARFRFEE